MKAIHITAIIAISFIAGMFGGAFSERVFASPKTDEKIPDQILARGFYLVDENNKPRAGMSFDGSGDPGLFVKDGAGKTRAYLACPDAGPMLVLTDITGAKTAFLNADNDGKSSMGLLGKKEGARLVMIYSPGSGPGIVLGDEKNAGNLAMAVNEGKAYLTLTQGDKKPAISLLSDPQKGAMLAAWNSQGRHRLSLGLMHDKPLLFAYNPDDTGLLFNTQRDGRPALGLLSEGRVVWSATGAAPQMPAMDGILDQILR